MIMKLKLFWKQLRALVCASYSGEIKKLTDKTIELLNEMEKIKSQIPKEDPMETHWNNRYPHVVVYYNGRSIPNYGNYKLDVRNFFINPNSDELHQIVKNWVSKPDDEKALLCQKWIANNIDYTPDPVQFGINEYWAYPQETLKTRKEDCDGGSILMANLMVASGIPYWKIRLAAGAG